jgi:hypothetical protein
LKFWRQTVMKEYLPPKPPLSSTIAAGSRFAMQTGDGRQWRIAAHQDTIWTSNVAQRDRSESFLPIRSD